MQAGPCPTEGGVGWGAGSGGPSPCLHPTRRDPSAPLPSQVGFLKILHKYEITFLLPPSQRLGKDVCAVPLPNLNLRVLSVTSVPEGKVPASRHRVRPSGPRLPSGSRGWLPSPGGHHHREPELTDPPRA